MPYIVPYPGPAPQTGLGNLLEPWGEGIARTKDKLKDALLAVLTAGMYQGQGPMAPKNIPNPGYGQSGSPGTVFSNGGGQGQLSPPQNPQQIQQGFRTPQAATPFATQPMLNASQMSGLQSAQDYQKDAAGLANTQAYTGYLNRMNQPNNPAASAQGNSALVAYLAKQALAGDAEADAHLKALGY